MRKECQICRKCLEGKKRGEYREVQGIYYCVKCYRTKHRPSVSNEPEVRECEPEMREFELECVNEKSKIQLHLPTVPVNSAKCIFRCPPRHLRQLTKNECLEVFIKTNIFVRHGSRVCILHGQGETFQIPDNFTSHIFGTFLNANEISSVISELKCMVVNERAKMNQRESFLDMDEDKLQFETGLNKSQFSLLLSCLPDNLGVGNIARTLGIYLSRLRRGYTYDELGCRWNVARQTASKYCEIIRGVLVESADVSLNLTCSRNDLLGHRTMVSKRLHSPSGDHAILILDGTYIFIEKSGNFSFQRLTYSGHKHRNLIKPMMAVCPDGNIAAVWGPYPGNKNDASIMTELLQQNIWKSFKNGDVLVVDRGFRDSMEDISKKQFVGKMPSFSDTPSAALTTEQANSSRLVTKTRYIVEVVNGRLKKWFKYFDKTVHNTTLSYLFDDFKIACFLHNLIFKPVKSSALDLEIVERMLSFSDKENKLSALVSDFNLNARRSSFKRLEMADLEFPQLTMHDLCLYACGSYQIKMAASYYQDHLNKQGDFEFEVANEAVHANYTQYRIPVQANNSVLFKIRLRSRHSNSIKYFVYVLIDRTKENIGAIIGHTCACKVGQRVVGCCSHVATVLWFFGYARHQDYIPLPASYLNNYFLEAPGTVLDEPNEDSDEEDKD